MRPVLEQRHNTGLYEGVENRMKVIFAFRLVEEDVTDPSRPIIFDKLPQIQRFIPNPDAEGYTLSWGE